MLWFFDVAPFQALLSRKWVLLLGCVFCDFVGLKMIFGYTSELI
jgi:hypothetical protein